MQIKYFSWVKDQIGIESENITITEKIDSVIDLITFLKNKNEKYCKAFEDLSVIRCAVNMEVTNLEKKISDNDEIAFFPPMTGG
ncbi:MAG: molybdopterin converting factor subunit 1 [Alphaproteobacteria bacterium]|nr:molybdopterin converting factor subunit 1 [Alphaproteobacteria bacterium]|tara:strand:+ start:496 stop:747 length:252 start_codon:yes stop_codon:yes gene_type:complete